MKSIVKVMMLILSMACYKGYAQMGSAKTVSWDVDVRFVVPVQQDSIWTVWKDYTLVPHISNGYVQRIVNEDNILPIRRQVYLSNGQKRTEILTQLDEQHKFLVYHIDESSLPEGLKLIQIAIFTKEGEDGKTELNCKAIVNGDKSVKNKVIEQIKAEIEQYQLGLNDYFGTGSK